MNTTTPDTTDLSNVPVADFDPLRGWLNPSEAKTRARWCCEKLEEGRILFFSSLPFELPELERKFLLAQSLGGTPFHKNISYRPGQDLLRGFDSNDAAAKAQMHKFMRRYSEKVTKFLSQLLSPYASHWALDYASFRPEAEEGRKLPLRKRNDLLHVDAFPTRPTRGGRILRCFSNINPTHPRLWITTDGFPTLASSYAQEAGLDSIARRGTPLMENFLHTLKQTFGAKTRVPSAYDKFMLQFHHYLKENSGFQQNCRKVKLEYPPGSTWICFTDSVPHAVTHGQYALEQTFIVPLEAMVNPQQAPLRILESLAGRPLVSGNTRQAQSL